MGLTILLARVFGVYLCVMGVAIFKNSKHIEAAVEEMSGSHFAQLVAGIIPLFIGSFLVNIHNVWGGNGLVCAVSLVSWLFLIGGTFRLVFTDQWITVVRQFKDLLIRPAGIVCLLGGLVFLYYGFFA